MLSPCSTSSSSSSMSSSTVMAAAHNTKWYCPRCHVMSGPRVTQTVRSNLFPVKDPSISLWGPHQLPASPKQTFRKQQSPFSMLDPTYTGTHRCHADCSIQLVPCERPFNLTVGTSPVACKPKANFPETTIPVFNFRSNFTSPLSRRLFDPTCSL